MHGFFKKYCHLKREKYTAKDNLKGGPRLKMTSSLDTSNYAKSQLNLWFENITIISRLVYFKILLPSQFLKFKQPQEWQRRHFN